MATRKPIDIPVVSAAQQDEAPACSGFELSALMVLGDSMTPEFNEGEIIIIEMGVAAAEGAFVIAEADGELVFRQLKRDAQGDWQLHALNPAHPDIAIPGLDGIKGVVTHKRQARSRKSVKHYGAQTAH